MEQPHHIYANLELMFSILVDVSRKVHAKDAADKLLNANNFRMTELLLTGNDGRKYQFRVLNVKDIQWFHVRSLEFSRMFRVYGRMELTLAGLDADPFHADIPVFQELEFPHSRISTKPILTIPAGKGQVNARIDRHLLKWQPKSGIQA